MGCVKPVPPPDIYEGGSRQEAIDQQRADALVDDRDQALDQLRLASMALAMGDRDEGEAAMRRAVVTMTTFQADGEFAARIGAEDNKEWKGEPYEKMAAFTTLGMLLWSEGDAGNALAMFKSAVLADTGSKQEAFRSDFLPGWVLQALVYAQEGERDNAEAMLERGIDAYWSRRTVETLTQALKYTRTRTMTSEQMDATRAAVLAGLSAGVSRAPRDPAAAARATLAVLPDLLRIQEERPKKERLPSLQQFSRSDFDTARRGLDGFGEAWVANAGSHSAETQAEGADWTHRMESLLTEAPQIVLLVERGSAPRKVQMGDYGELLAIRPGVRPMSAPVVTIDEQVVRPLFLDDTHFQAVTRGGRRVDAFLKGKAVYKDASLIGGYVALRVAELAYITDNDAVAAAAAIVGGVLAISSLVTNPAADIRRWEHAPGGWYLVAVPAEPGVHRVNIGQRAYTVEVPARGSAVHLIPRLRPGGAKTL
jgi:hypothetical protein